MTPSSVLALLGALGAAVTGLRWLTGARVDGLGRPRGFPLLPVVVLLVLATGSLVPTLLRVREQRTLGQAASAVAGVHVDVVCQSLGGALVDARAEAGWVRFSADGVPEHVAHLAREQCAVLRGYLRSDRRDPTRQQVVAVHVLTHEAVHAGGSRQEGLTECRAVQRDAATARALGAPAGAGRLLARRYWRVDYPRLPEDYRDARCAPGGPLDEHLPDAPWG